MSDDEYSEDSGDEDDRVRSEGADENFEPPRKRRSSDEDDESIELIRKRPKSDEEDDGHSDEAVETPKELQTQVFPDV